MARIVTCAVTKEKGTSDVFYKADNGKWYKSESVFRQFQKDKHTRETIQRVLLTYLGYQKGEPFPALLNKKIKEYSFYSPEVLLETITKCEKDITWAFNNKEFSSTQGKIFYMFAIISNHISDVNRQNNKVNELRNKQTQKHIDTIQEMDISTIGTSKKGKDITDFLEDDLWN